MKNALSVISLLAITSLMACQVKTSSGAGDIPLNPLNQGPATVSGPDLTGQWESECIANPLIPGGTRILSVKFEGANFEQQEKNFSDDRCANAGEVETLKGTYSFLKDLGQSIFRIEYRMPAGGGASAIRERNISLVGEDLKVSEYISDFDSSNEVVAPKLVLHRKKAPAEGKPSPAPEAPAATGPLKSGTYHSEESSCDVSVSTMKAGGKTAAVYLQFQYPCTDTTSLEFNCDGNDCKQYDSEALKVTLIDANSFKFINVSNGKTALFQLR